MLNRRHFLAVLLPLPIVLGSCDIDTINSFPVKNAHVRVINVIPNATALNFSVDGGVKWASVPFEGMSTYEDFSNETHTFSATVAGAPTALTQGNFNLAGDGFYTLVAFGAVETPSLALLSDDTVTPTSGRFLLRVAHLAANAQGLDVYLNTPGADINAIGPTFSSVFFGGSTGFVQTSSGSLQLRMTIAGTKTVVYDSGPRNWPDNTATDAIAYTRNGGQLVNVALADINGASQRVIANSTLTQLKIVNAAFQTGAVNTYVEGGALPAATNLAYPAASGYSIIPQGPHFISFDAVSTPGAAVASLTTQLDSATDTTVVLTGFAGSLTTLPLHDFQFPITNGSNTRLRIVNASPDSPPVDVLVNTTRQVSALAPLTASSYIEVGNGTYTVTFNNATTGATLLTVSNVTLGQLQSSTLYLVGPTGQLSSLFTRDN